jgi:PLP dependent protein
MQDIASCYRQIRSGIPEKVRLVVVSKTRTIAEIRQVYDAGQRLFGENKAQELTAKAPHLPADIQWHFIGHLQTNKVRQIMPFVHTIQSIDSLKLLHEVESEAERISRKVSCLLQFHIAGEDTKFGFSMDEITGVLEGTLLKKFSFVNIAGVMGMATFTEDTGRILKEFQTLSRYYHMLKERFFPADDSFSEISMGMSDDYHHAIACGSTMVRIGSAIFGPRHP